MDMKTYQKLEDFMIFEDLSGREGIIVKKEDALNTWYKIYTGGNCAYLTWNSCFAHSINKLYTLDDIHRRKRLSLSFLGMSDQYQRNHIKKFYKVFWDSSEITTSSNPTIITPSKALEILELYYGNEVAFSFNEEKEKRWRFVR